MTSRDCCSLLAAFESPEKQLRSVQLLLQLLPQDNRDFLEELLPLLHNVTAHPSTRMTSQTLGTLFAPHLLASRGADAEEMLEQYNSGQSTTLMALLIERHDAVLKVRSGQSTTLMTLLIERHDAVLKLRCCQSTTLMALLIERHDAVLPTLGAL